MFLSEVFNDTLDVIWIHKNEGKWVGSFELSESHRCAVALKYHPIHDGIEVGFSTINLAGDIKKPRTDLVGDVPNKFALLGTVIDAMEQYNSTHQPQSFFFYANADDDSRVSLYRTICQKYEKSNKVQFVEDEESAGKIKLNLHPIR